MRACRKSYPRSRWCTLGAALSVVANVAQSQQPLATEPVTTPPPIQLQSRVVDVAAATRGSDGHVESGRVHLLASFAKEVTREQIVRLRALDVAVLDHCPVNAYVLGVPVDLLDRGTLLRSLPPSTRLAPLRPTDKLSRRLLPKGENDPPRVPPYTARRNDLVEAIVLFFGDLREERFQTDALSQHRAVPLQRLSAINGWRVALPEEEIGRLAERDAVKWIEEGPPPPHDDNKEVRGPDGVDADVVQAGVSSTGYGLSGQGVTIAQWETTSASIAHKDLASRVSLGDSVVAPDSRFYRYADVAGDANYNGGEPFYLDVDDSLSVTPGDLRAASIGTLTPGTVQPGDADVTVQPTRLRELRYWDKPFEAFLDSAPANNGLFNPGEAIYLEQDKLLGRHRVSTGEVCTRQEMGGPGADKDCGDIRLTAVPPYAAGSTVQPDDDDIGRTLKSYPTLPRESPHHHSTHVAGTMIGAGGDEYRGVAPGARLISYHVKRLGVGADDSELPDEHATAIAAGATIANNSWGVQDYYCALNDSGYGVRSTMNDALASGFNSDGTTATANRMLLAFSAGNSYTLDCSPYWLPPALVPLVPNELWGTVQATNSAKNVLTVANVAPGSASANTPAVLSTDSLRGPTGQPAVPLLDGRLKPDISAPGRERWNYHGVMSTVPPRDLLPNGSYAGNGGTSMATPAVSGSAALLTEWYRRACDADGPTPDLLRATLVHTADDVQAFLEGVAEVVNADNELEGPDYGSGYGMVDVANAVKVMMHHRLGALSDDGLIEYPLLVGDVPELKVTLAWDDPPYSCLCAVSAEHGLLQNDLDVTLTDPAGNKYAPWQLDPGNPGAKAQTSGPIAGDISPYRDHRNTIEQIVVRDPIPGGWKISVSASKFNNVFPEQQFAVVSEFLSPTSDDPAYCPDPVKTDIWLRDNAADVGATPSTTPLYYSPDVWNRVAADGGTTHQNPVAGATNYMYARLHNDRPQPSTAHAVSLELWLAPAATGLDWPQDFGLVGRADIVQLQPGEVRTLDPIPWLVPSPQPSDHFCFYARAMSPQDPIAVAETGALGTIVASSNNIAWRNVNVVDLDAADVAAPQDIDFQVGPVGADPEERAGASEAPIDIELIVPEALLAAARIQLRLPAELDHRWRATLSSGPRPERHADAQVLRPDMTAAGVYPIKHPHSILIDLPLQAGERVPVRLTLDATPALGRGSYPIEIRQHQGGTVVGGIIYEATVLGSH